MTHDTIDLRSDTVTQPTTAMRKAISEAEVGDDVFGDDPTVYRLEHRIAEILGKEAAIYMPSGTMTNQVAVRIHCKPGDDFICEAGCHIFNYEQGAFAQLSGVVARTVPGEYGVLHADQLRPMLRPDNDHLTRTRLVCLENTHNRGAGRIQPYEDVVEICHWAHENALQTHLDGARIFNAVVATGIAADTWVKHFDTVSVCFSKGLGAPVGSALAGPERLMKEARRHRKVFGGGMRQAGIIAAGALYALENNIERLKEDHANAQILTAAILATEDLELRPSEMDTNIVIFHVDPDLATAQEFVTALSEQGIRMLAIDPEQIRAVTHLHITEADAKRAAEMIKEVTANFATSIVSR